MTDILERAGKHQWWYSDQSMALDLVHEIKQLRECSAGWIEQHKVDRVHMVAKDKEIERLRGLIQAFIAHLEEEWLPSQYDKDDYPESCLLIQQGREVLGND